MTNSQLFIAIAVPTFAILWNLIAIHGLRNDFNSLAKELRGEIQGLRSDLGGEIQGLRNEVRELRTEVSEVKVAVANLRPELYEEFTLKT